jgi:hypothetical protein
VRQGGQIPLSSYTTDISWRPQPFSGTADPDRVATLFAEGATIVLQGLHHTWPPLARYCRSLEAELDEPAQANVYYTPAQSQGFGVHHDTHDVLCLQVTGYKRWLVYPPRLELPLKHQRYSPALGEPGEPVLDLTLGAGDTLYLPRGWLHEALTSDADSLHVTVGINVYTWLDALRAALTELEADVDARRSPRNGKDPAGLLEALRRQLSGDEVARRRRAKLVSTRRPILDGQLSEVRAAAELTAGTPVERRETVIADLDGTTLSFEGKTVSFPAHAQEELAAVVGSEGPFCASELPGSLDDESRLVLVRRLVREGFLRRSDGGA